MEYTYCMIKPDGVKKEIFGEVVHRFRNHELNLVKVEVMNLNKEILREHYSHIVDRDFYPKLEEAMLSGPVIAMLVKGENAVARTRELIGATNSKDALPGTIRGDYGDKEKCHLNVIHGSDSVENAKIEIARFFGKNAIEEIEDNISKRIRK